MARTPAHTTGLPRLLRRQQPRREEGEAGYSLALTLLVVLASLLATVALALRGGSGQLAAAWQSQSREARQTAEAGLTAIIGELNKAPNRRMLVSGRGLGAWSSSPDALQQNPCLQSTAVVPTTSLARSYGGATTQNLDGDTSRSFVLRSVRYANNTRDRWLESRYDAAGNLISSSSGTSYDNSGNQLVNLKASTPPAVGYLQLGVEGRLSRGGTVVARSLVTREYQVVPKCCGRSFYGPGGVFGVDARSCNNGASDGKLGLVVGFSGGGISVTGQSGTVLGPDGDRLDAVLCVTTGSSCSSTGITTQTGSVPVLPITLEVQPAPSPPSSLTSSAALTLNGTQNKVLRFNSAGTAMELCDVSGSTVSGCTATGYCLVQTNSTADGHCRLQRLDLSGSAQLAIDSSRGRIALYFNDGSGSTAGTINTGGSTGLRHMRCSTPPAATAHCTTAAGLVDFDRLAFYGNQTFNSLNLQGTPQALSFFVYFPKGTVTLGGNSSAMGSIWSNTLAMNGNFRIAVPATGCELNSQGFCSLTNGDNGTLLFDWVARSTSQTRFY